MTMRLIELHRILKDTGSVYLHADQTMSHSLKLVMDAIFGKKNFKNEIIWCYTQLGGAKKSFPKKHDAILCYSKNHKESKFNPVYVPYKKSNKCLGVYKAKKMSKKDLKKS